jgi:hypothetical protein
VKQYGVEAVSVAHPQNNEVVLSLNARQSETCMGNSFVKNRLQNLLKVTNLVMEKIMILVCN